LIYLYLKHTKLYKVTKLLENKGYTVYSLKNDVHEVIGQQGLRSTFFKD